MADRTVADWTEGAVTVYRPRSPAAWFGLLGLLSEGCAELDLSAETLAEMGGGRAELCCVEILPGLRAEIALLPEPK